MTARNDVTGDAIVTKKSSDQYRDGWDRIFGNKDKKDDPNSNKNNSEQPAVDSKK